MALKNKPPLQLQIEAILKNNPFVEATELVQIADLFPEGEGQEDEYDLSNEWLLRIFGYIGCHSFADWPIVWLTTRIAYHAETHNVSYCEGEGLRHRDFIHIITRTQLQYLMYGLGLPMYQQDPECIDANAPEKAETTEGPLPTDEPHPVWEKPAGENYSVPAESILPLCLSNPEANTIRFFFNEENGAPREIARIGADGFFRVSVAPDDKTAAQFIECVNALCGMNSPPNEFKGMTSQL